jgi:hypothetical protein
MGVWLPGLEMGAMGMASQMVLLGIVSVNVQAWVIARDGGWEFDWVFQIVGIPMMIGIGVAVKYLVGKLWVLENAGMHELLAPVIVMSGAYLLIVMTVIWQFPWMVGLEHSEIKRIVKRLSRTKA